MIYFMYILIAITLVLSIFLFGGKQSNFFDFSSVFSNHFSIFNKAKFHLIAIVILPATISLFIIYFRLIDSEVLMGLNTVLSIFTAIFLSMLGIITSLKKPNENKNQSYNQVLKETFYTVLFEALITIFILIFSLVYLLIGEFCLLIITEFASFIIYYLTVFMFLNSFIIIKRLSRLFDLY